jgi:hypothetical protein
MGDITRTELKTLTYRIIDLPVAKMRMAFPVNTFTAKIVGDHVEIDISTDLRGLESVSRRLEALRKVIEIPIEQPELLNVPRDMVLGDIAQPATPEGGAA